MYLVWRRRAFDKLFFFHEKNVILFSYRELGAVRFHTTSITRQFNKPSKPLLRNCTKTIKYFLGTRGKVIPYRFIVLRSMDQGAAEQRFRLEPLYHFLSTTQN